MSMLLTTTRPQTLASIHIPDPIAAILSVQVAALTIVAWDWLITLDLEFSLVWTRRRSLGKILFFINRYTLLLCFVCDTLFAFRPDLLPLKSCWPYHFTSETVNVVGVMAVQSILALRTYALYQTRWCLYLLVGLLISVIIMAFAVLWYLQLKFITYEPFGPICMFTCTDPFCNGSWYWTWASNLAFDTIIFFLTLHQFHKNWRLRWSIADHEDPNQIRALHNSGFLRALFRDGMAYFFLIFGVVLVNLILIIIDSEFATLAFSLTRALQTVACSRLFLNLRSSLNEQVLSMVPIRNHITMDNENAQEQSSSVEDGTENMGMCSVSGDGGQHSATISP